MDTFTRANNTEDETIKGNNTLSYTLIGIIIVLLGYIGYIYNSHDLLKKGELKKTYIKKESISFSDLPSYAKSDYITKYDYTKKVDQLNSKINDLETKISANDIVTVQNKEERTVESITETKVITPEKDKTKAKLKFVSFKCYDMIDGGYYPSKKCVKDLNIFLDHHKDAETFEVIGVVNTKEFDLIRKLKDVYGNGEVARLSEFAQLGLSRKRVVEGTWVIKNHLGTKTNVQVVNYTITSKKGNKGFVVRAYK